MQPLSKKNVEAACWGNSRWIVRFFLWSAALCLHASVSLAANAAGSVTSDLSLKNWQYQALLQSLLDPAPQTQSAALTWLHDNGRPDRPDRVPPRLLDELGSRLSKPSSANEHAATLRAMASLGEACARFAPEVAALLKDGDLDVREGAAQALGKFGAAGAPFAPAVAALLKDENSPVRANAAQALGAMGAAGAPFAPAVAAVLNDGNTSVRANAVQALGAMGAAGAPFGPAVAALLKEGDPSVRANAVQALGKLGATGAPFAPAVAALLKEGNASVRADAAQALGAMGAAGAPFAPAVAALLKDGIPFVREGAARALGAMGAAGAPFAPAVAALLKDDNPSVRANAVQAVGAMGAAGAPFAPAVATLLKDGESYVRQAAVQVLGAMGATGAPFAPAVAALLKDDDLLVRSDAVQALGAMGAAATTVAPTVAALLKDGDADMRAGAVQALGAMGAAGAPFAPAIAMLLKDGDWDVRIRASYALGTLAQRIGPISTPALLATCLEGTLFSRDQAAQLRLTCHLLGALTDDEEVLMKWVNNWETGGFGNPGTLTRESAIKVLKALQSLWPDIDARDSHTKTVLNPILRRQVAAGVESIVNAQAAQFSLKDVPLIDDWILNLKRAHFGGEAASLRDVRDRIEDVSKAKKGAIVIAGHIGLWILLLWAYPRWRPVQSFFFWNRWGRRFVGLGYVGLLITYVPWLRQRMFVPFQPSLVQRGALSGFDASSYFPDSDVAEQGVHSCRPLSAVLPEVTGQVVLEGESGLGKTTAVLRLASTSRRIAVLLRATECSQGVVAAVQSRLKGQVGDEKYLRSLIHVGAIDVLIDGLNEATPDARSRIVQFVEESFRGNFILTTQPMDWVRPRTARVLRLRALRPDQIEDFLHRQWPAVRGDARMDEVAYGQVVKGYVVEIAAEDEAESWLKVLSNPMEASLVAELLSRGERPNLLRLVEQRFVAMEKEFHERENRPFPYSRFAEQVYTWRVSGKPYYDPAGFDAEVAMLVEHKLMIARTVSVRSPDAIKEENRWWFRHDKFMEFCLLPAFLDDHAERQRQHASDEPFFGVYELLALKLSDDDELKLRDFLVEQAADAQRNDLLNRYTVVRRNRRVQEDRAIQPVRS